MLAGGEGEAGVDAYAAKWKKMYMDALGNLVKPDKWRHLRNIAAGDSGDVTEYYSYTRRAAGAELAAGRGVRRGR